MLYSMSQHMCYNDYGPPRLAELSVTLSNSRALSPNTIMKHAPLVPLLRARALETGRGGFQSPSGPLLNRLHLSE